MGIATVHFFALFELAAAIICARFGDGLRSRILIRKPSLPEFRRRDAEKMPEFNGKKRLRVVSAAFGNAAYRLHGCLHQMETMPQPYPVNDRLDARSLLFQSPAERRLTYGHMYRKPLDIPVTLNDLTDDFMNLVTKPRGSRNRTHILVSRKI